MTTLAENVIVVGADNHPPMLDKSMYNSWRSRMILYIRGKKHGRIIVNSILNGPLVYGTIEVDGITRTKTYEELSDQVKLQDDYDVRATNIVLQGLPPDVYSLVNHHDVAKDIWDRVRLLMQGTKLSQQERECKLYNEFDRFTSVKGESLHEYYLRFAQLINDMHTIEMTMQQVQVNTNQHEVHANEVRQMHERFSDPLALVANYHHIPSYQNTYQAQYNPSDYQQQMLHVLDSGLAVPSFLPGDDPITSLNKAMAFLRTSITSRFPTTNNQLRTSFNLRNNATV
ncbi:hypothetical protein Tco_0990717 [Tanacetum coccineum]|uniref:Integrase, catalytic region, zinc finger, CCHC-type, peptidase aspartic, catalytic n=1 Tax=Tanacetum coccineum TaxID=301880 RepID=A0ABQ5EX88_9ASTR